ncbi:histone H1-like isoform X2 [Drosophila miranda]|uniref:histone H1-like isoform X2 n=1 Tax=Drosophila miranda TaxID=7229 RepID=UPI00143FA3EF|nr:histone H1-like isoform X2 [Drosophila miranda]
MRQPKDQLTGPQCSGRRKIILGGKFQIQDIGFSVTGDFCKEVPKPSASSSPSITSPTRDMVDASIKSLNERGGFSYLAIKKYIAAEYKCDAQKLTPFIKKYLKSAVADGKLIETSGTGASGSFKLSASVERKDKEAKKERKAKNTASPKRATRAATRSQMRNEAKMSDAAKKTARRR